MQWHGFCTFVQRLNSSLRRVCKEPLMFMASLTEDARTSALIQQSYYTVPSRIKDFSSGALIP